MTRIKYTKNNYNYLHSKFFLLNGRDLYIKINPKDFTFSIIAYDAEDEQDYLVSVTCNSVRSCKYHAKLKLKELGVNFNNEVRRFNV